MFCDNFQYATKMQILCRIKIIY